MLHKIFQELQQVGYEKQQANESAARIIMKGDPQQSNKFVRVNPKVEKKVRGLLEGTELVEIAKTAKIVVEIVKDDPQ